MARLILMRFVSIPPFGKITALTTATSGHGEGFGSRDTWYGLAPKSSTLSNIWIFEPKDFFYFNKDFVQIDFRSPRMQKMKKSGKQDPVSGKILLKVS